MDKKGKYSVRFAGSGEQRISDICAMLELDKLYETVERVDGVDEIHQGNMNDCLSWVEKNDKICHFLVDNETERVVGYLTAIPLEKGVFEEIAGGRLSDVELKPRHIAKYEKNGSYDLFLMDIVVYPEHRGEGSRFLSKSFADNMKTFERELGIKFNRVVGEVVSHNGEKIMKKRFGAETVGKSKYGYEVMVGTIAAYYKYNGQKNMS